MDYLLDILMPVYNHEKYIKEALDGVVMQKTNFNFRLIIGEDFSTDKTRPIIESYSNKYPEIVHAFYREKNLGAYVNSGLLFNEMKAKYIAICEGDDFWIDPLKLQTQIDFLEKNPDYSMSFHNVYEWEEGKEIVLTKVGPKRDVDSFTIYDLAEGNFIHTPSIVFRNIFTKGMPEWFGKSPVGDYVLNMLLAETGKIKYFSKPMAVYRRNVGFWSVQSQLVMWERWLVVLDLLKAHFRNHEVLGTIIRQESQIIAQIIASCKNLQQVVEDLRLKPSKIAQQVTLKRLLSAVRIKVLNAVKRKVQINGTNEDMG